MKSYQKIIYMFLGLIIFFDYKCILLLQNTYMIERNIRY